MFMSRYCLRGSYCATTVLASDRFMTGLRHVSRHDIGSSRQACLCSLPNESIENVAHYQQLFGCVRAEASNLRQLRRHAIHGECQHDSHPGRRRAYLCAVLR